MLPMLVFKGILWVGCYQSAKSGAFVDRHPALVFTFRQTSVIFPVSHSYGKGGVTIYKSVCVGYNEYEEEAHSCALTQDILFYDGIFYGDGMMFRIKAKDYKTVAQLCEELEKHIDEYVVSAWDGGSKNLLSKQNLLEMVRETRDYLTDRAQKNRK